MRIRDSIDREEVKTSEHAKKGTPKDTMHQRTGQQTAWEEGRTAKEGRFSVGHQSVRFKTHMHHKMGYK